MELNCHCHPICNKSDRQTDRRFLTCCTICWTCAGHAGIYCTSVGDGAAAATPPAAAADAAGCDARRRLDVQAYIISAGRGRERHGGTPGRVAAGCGARRHAPAVVPLEPGLSRHVEVVSREPGLSRHVDVVSRSHNALNQPLTTTTTR